MTWSPQGQRLASSSEDGTLRFWNIETKRCRIVEVDGGPATSVAWSSDDKLLAYGTSDGTVVLYDAFALEARDPERRHARYARDESIQCITWAPHDLRLAFASNDHNIYFKDCRPGQEYAPLEIGTGHASIVRSLAWSPDGMTLVSGTSSGSLGVWERNDIDNQLRHFLPGRTPRPHADEVLDLAWSQRINTLASASLDGSIQLWNVPERRHLETLQLDEPVFAIDFSPDGTLLVAQTREKLRFVRCHSMVELYALDLPAYANTGCVVVHPHSSLVAVIDSQEHAIAVWKVDFAGLMRNAEITRRRYRNAKVLVLGGAASGKTNLALALTNAPFCESPTEHGLQVHSLDLPESYYDDKTCESREIIFWDLPNHGYPDFVQRMHVDDMAAVLFVFDARSPLAALPTLRQLEQSIRPIASPARSGKTDTRFLVAAKFDRAPSWHGNEVQRTFSHHFPDLPVFLTSAQKNIGIHELREKVCSAIDWTALPCVDSVEIFDDVLRFVEQQKEKGLYLSSVSSLYSLLTSVYPHLRQELSVDDFRTSLVLLENLNVLHHFSFGDLLLLQPGYWYAYTTALIAAAGRDTGEMGRLPIEEAESGDGKQFQLPESDRIPDTTQESLLLKATIEELLQTRLASEVSTDGKSYLVFPTQPTRELQHASARQRQDAWCTFSGDSEKIYSSLVVRLLGLPSFFPEFKLWKNAAEFSTTNKSSCGILLDTKGQPDSGEISLFFDDHASALTKQTFLAFVRAHIEKEAQPDTIEWTLNQPLLAEADPQLPLRRVKVFLCYESEDLTCSTNVIRIATELKQRNIDPWIEEWEVKAGDPKDKRTRVRETYNIAVVAVSKSRLSRALGADCKAFKERRCRIIPVILPNAPRNFSMPEPLRQYKWVDFRELGPRPYDDLVQGIMAASETEGTEQNPSESAIKKHIFLSYCRDNTGMAKKLRDELIDAGHMVWWDQDIPKGRDWRHEIRDAMQQAYAVIVCFSREVEQRDQSGIYPEIAMAIEVYRMLPPNSIYLIPVRLSDCELPSVRINDASYLDSLQCVDLYSSRRLHEFRRLVDSLEMARSRSR
jgi:WD40 repeat protein